MIGHDRPGLNKQLSTPLLGAQGARANRKTSYMAAGPIKAFGDDERFLNHAYYKEAAKRFYRYDGTLWRETLVPEANGFVLWPWGLITAWCFLLTVAIEFFSLPSMGNMPATVHTVLGGALSFLLVFRTNAAYARWWEARLTWGVINNTSRALAAQAAATMKTHAALTQLITELLAFAVCLKSQLRGKPTVPEELSGTMLTHEQLALLNDAVCPPIAAVEALSHTLRTGVRTTDEGGLLAGTTYLHLSQSLNDLVNAVGACERLVNTNTPYGYVSALRAFMMIWLVTLPFTLIGTYVWTATPAVSIVAFVFLTVEHMAMEIEQPFGDDPNDLPLEEYCLGIERVLLDILKRALRPSWAESASSSSAAAMSAFAELPEQEDEAPTPQEEESRRSPKFLPRPGAPSLDDRMMGRGGVVKQTPAATSSPGAGPGLRKDSKSIPLPEGAVPTPPKPKAKKMSILEQKLQAERAMNEAKALLAEQDDEM